MNDPLWMDSRTEDAILGEAARRRQRFQSLVSGVDPAVALRAAELTRLSPSASPGMVQAGAESGIDDERFVQVAGLDGSGFSSFVSDVAGVVSDGADLVYEQALKPLVRGTFVLAETAAQEIVQRPLTALSATAFGDAESFGQAYDEYGESAGFTLVDNLIDDDPNTTADLGTGFFAGGQIGEQVEEDRTLEIDGQRATFGRALPTTRLVGQVFGHDSTAYNTVAGVSQFAADVLLDPVALGSGGSSVLARAATKAGVVADGGRAQRAIAGGMQGVRRDARMLDAADAADILRETPDMATSILREAGGLSANGRNTVLIEKAQDFFGDRNLLSRLAEADSYTIRQSFKRSSANAVDNRLIRDLGRATDESEISRVLLDSVQRGQVTEKGFYSGLSGFRRRVNNTRLAGSSARGRVSVEDLDDAADKLDSFMRQAKVPERELSETGELIGGRAAIFDRILDLEDAPLEEQSELFFGIVEDAMSSVGDRLSGETEKIRELVRVGRAQVEHLREFGIDEAGDVIATPLFKPKVDAGTGQLVPTVGPQLTSELANIGFELPDVTAIRRAAQRASRMEKVYSSAGWETASDTARFLTRDLFKPLAILRPAYVVRIGLEEQARLAAAGYDSLLTHPARFIMANVMARTDKGAAGRTASSRTMRALSGVDDVTTDVSLTGDNWEDVADAMNVVNRRAYNVMSDSTQGRARMFTQMRKPAEVNSEFTAAWQHELAQLTSAREARWLARNGGDIDGFVDWARNTAEGRQTVTRIARVNEEAAGLLNSDDALREWGQSINVRLAAKTGGEVGDDGVINALGDPDLLDAIASGRLFGSGLADQSKTATANIHRLLRSKFDKAPSVIKAELKDEGVARHQGRLNQFVDGLFDNLTGKPTTRLARYPAFRQAYIKRAGEAFSALSDDASRIAFSRQIDEMFTLTKAERMDLASQVARHTGRKGVIDDITELDEIVKLRAATEVKDLLFDVTNRSNIQDAYEVAVPFFDAWLEVTRTWGRLAAENPAFMLKAGQGYQSLQDSGVIYANDFGEEVFAYPLIGRLGEFFGGGENAQLTMEGRVQGANLVAQGVGPGFGPVIQWATGAFMPDDREWQEVRDWMAPFGTAGVESAGDLANPTGVLGALIPAWAEKGLQAMSGGKLDPIQWNGVVGDQLKVLAESDRYDPANPEDADRMIEDAKRGAKWVFALRAFTQGVGITGASATWRINADVDESAIPEGWDPETDPDGVWHTIGVLGNELHRLAEFYGGDYSAAGAKFTEMYGLEPHYLTQAKSRSLGEFPVTTEGDYWMRDHEEFARRHAGVAGYFTPLEADPELDYAVYRRQFSEGTRQSLTGEQQLALANQSRARSIYYATRDRLAEVPAAQRNPALRQVRALLEEQFPGWQEDVLGVSSSMDQATKIRKLDEAVRDPDVADAPVTAPLTTYMNARQQLLAVAESRGFASLDNQESADLRGGLMQIGQILAAENPEFVGVWSQLLQREVDG